MPCWDDIIPEEDIAIYKAAGYGGKLTAGKRPALLLIDVTYSFVGDKPLAIMDSIKRFPNSCGYEAWQAVEKIKILIHKAREKKTPIFYTSVPRRNDGKDLGKWRSKQRRMMEDPSGEKDIGSQIVSEIAPGENDFVIIKSKPSAFFGTPLMSILHELNIDTLIICGGTTSGCVRATVIDAFSYNFNVLVVEDCTFDRSTLVHKVNHFDMDAKYANVIKSEEVISYLDKNAECESR